MTRAGEKLYSDEWWRTNCVSPPRVSAVRWILAAIVVGVMIGSALR